MADTPGLPVPALVPNTAESAVQLVDVLSLVVGPIVVLLQVHQNVCVVLLSVQGSDDSSMRPRSLGGLPAHENSEDVVCVDGVVDAVDAAFELVESALGQVDGLAEEGVEIVGVLHCCS